MILGLDVYHGDSSVVALGPGGPAGLDRDRVVTCHFCGGRRVKELLRYDAGAWECLWEWAEGGAAASVGAVILPV